MADSQDETKRIAAELARIRVQLSDESLLLRRDLDVGRRMSESVREHSWGWMSLAAIFGWLLSRLPARKKKVYIHTTDPSKRVTYREGFMTQVWKGVWSITKPLVMAYLTKKIADKAKFPGAKWL
jgi:hypothetical protein